MPRACTDPFVGRVLRSLGVSALLFGSTAHADPNDDVAPGDRNDAQQGPATPPRPPVTDVATTPTPEPPRFDEKTHFSLSWVRLAGAEECVSARQLSRDVERRLHRPALGAPSETDVAIEGFIEKTEQGTFHAVVKIADARGRLLGKRELERPECRDMDAALALTIALMIDPDAAFAPTAMPARPRDTKPVAVVPKKALPPRSYVQGEVSAGVGLGFGSLPHTAGEAWILGSVKPPQLFPIEVGAHLSLDQTISIGQDVRVAFSRSTLDVAVCPLDAHVSVLRLGACAGVEAGVLGASGVARTDLDHQRSVIVDAVFRGHVDVIARHGFALRIIPALGVPFVRDSFDYRRDDQPLERAFRLPAIRGEIAVGVGIELP